MNDEWLFVTSDRVFEGLAMAYYLDLQHDDRLKINADHSIANLQECWDMFEALPESEQEAIAWQWVIDMPDDYQNEWEDFLDAN